MVWPAINTGRTWANYLLAVQSRELWCFRFVFFDRSLTNADANPPMVCRYARSKRRRRVWNQAPCCRRLVVVVAGARRAMIRFLCWKYVPVSVVVSLSGLFTGFVARDVRPCFFFGCSSAPSSASLCLFWMFARCFGAATTGLCKRWNQLLLIKNTLYCGQVR